MTWAGRWRSGTQWCDERIWPIAITVGLLLVVAVNVAFIVIAVRGADPVAESYEAGER